MKIGTLLGGLAIAAGIAVIGSGGAVAAALNCGMNTGKAAIGEPIVIGAVVGQTGPDDFSSASRAANAFFKCVNANGGIHGRPIRYLIADDAWNPEQSAEVATRLVKDDHVVTMVGNTSFVDCAANEALYEASNVVVIAGVGVPRECFFSKNIAPVNEGPRIGNIGAAEYMWKTFGAKRFVCISPDVPNVGKWNCDAIAEWGKDKGVKVKNILFDPSSLDATSFLLQAMAFHPDVIDISITKAMAVTVLAAAEEQQLGDKVRWTGPTSLYDRDLPKAAGPYWSGKVYVELELEPLDKQSPDMLNWHAVLDKYGYPSDPRDTFSQAGYLSARIVVATLLKMDPNKINRDSVTRALRAVKGFSSDIMCGKWYFGPGSHHNANHAGSIAVFYKGGYKTVARCTEIDDPDLVDLKRLEKKLHLND